jgi:carboxymethylenebutenolidase
MCFDADAHPPDLPFPLAGGAGDGRSLTLTAADGNRFPAYAAVPLEAGGEPAAAGGGAPAVPPGMGIVVIPDIRGLVPFYEELALRFAQAGVAAVAIDPYARTAPTTERGQDFDSMAHSAQTTQEGIAADVAAAAAFLRSDEIGATGALFSVGFCFGGRASLLQGIEDHGLAGVIGFYGPPTGPARNGSVAPADVAARDQSAVLGLYGGADRGIPPEAVETFDRALEAAGVDHDIVVYPDAPHSFFDRHQAEYGEASADAWRRILDFMSRHAASGTQAPA